MQQQPVFQSRIGLVASTILIVIVILVGVMVFYIMARHSERLLSASLQSSLQNHVELAQFDIRRGADNAESIATRPLLLDQMQRGMQEKGLAPPEQFGEAGRAMEEAQRALREGDLAGAADAEGRALEQLRQGARNMAEQMMRRMQQNAGQDPGNGPNGNPGTLDPLGRAQAPLPDAFDPGLLTKIPDQIDAQRAREILEELRKRLGEQNRPTIELDYLERLLKRF